MGFNTLSKNQNYDPQAQYQKTATKNLSKNPQKNKGIARQENFKNETDFRDWFIKWLENKKLGKAGVNKESKNTKKIKKTKKAEITQVEKEPQRQSGFGDISIHHTGLDLSYDHILANPLIIECKNKKSFRQAIAQAIRYKENSSQKYETQKNRKALRTAIVTPRSLSTAEIASRHGEEQPHKINYEAKRIYWKAGIGVIQSANPSTTVLSFNEGDMVKIQ